MSDNRLTRNALMAVVQVLVSGGVLFLLYRYLLRTIGAEQVGIWSIVLATASASRISEMGFTASAVKFTAKYIARGEKVKASEVIQTTALTIGVVLAFVLLGGYPVIVWLIGKVVPGANITDAIAILSYALMSVWIGAIAGVFLSGLDGCQRIDLRVLVSMVSTLFFLGLTWLLVPGHGLIGLAWAQIGQGMFMLLGGWVLLRRELPLKAFNWRYSLFREMFQYGFNFQVISIFVMVVDPATKALMAKFGGLTSVAYYEMANRMVSQFRSLLVSANQVMVPLVAELHENAPEKTLRAYSDSYRVIFFLAVPLFAGVTAVAPLASELWIGHYEQRFVVYAALISAAYLINTLSGPAYFASLGTGQMRWNTWAHIAITSLNIVLGYLLGVLWGGWGVVLGYALALAFGSCLNTLGYHWDNNAPLGALFPGESKRLAMACCMGLIAAWAAFHFLEVPTGSLTSAGLILVICFISVAPAFWMHPLRNKISCRIAAAFHF